MKKILVLACMALSLFAFVACNPNPAIKVAKVFLGDPTLENLMKIQELEEEMTDEEIQEYEEWVIEHKEELEVAIANLGF